MLVIRWGLRLRPATPATLSITPGTRRGEFIHSSPPTGSYHEKKRLDSYLNDTNGEFRTLLGSASAGRSSKLNTLAELGAMPTRAADGHVNRDRHFSPLHMLIPYRV
jgi:hypothetical protein